MRFLRAWIGLLLKGDSYLGRVVRVLGFVAALGVSLVLKDTMNVTIEWPWGAMLSAQVPFGLALSVLGATVYGFVTAGAAWVSSRGPNLVIGSMEPDPQGGQYRLRVRNHGSSEVEVSGWVDRVVDEQGRNIGEAEGIPSRLPLELHWSHHDGRSRAKLSKAHSAGETLGVCAARPNDEGAPRFLITAQAYHQHIPCTYEPGKAIWLQVRITGGGVSKTQWFGFEPDGSSAMHYGLSSRTAPRAVDAAPKSVQSLKHA